MRLEPLPVVAVGKKAELLVVDQLVLLALAERLDREPQLLLGLVHRLVVEVGDAAVDLQHGLGDAQLVLAGRGVVVHVGVRDDRLADVARGEVDGGLAVGVGALVGRRRDPREVGGERAGPVREVPYVVPGELQDRAGRGGPGGPVPGGVRVDQRGLAEVGAVGQDAEDGLVAVGPLADLLDAAVREEVHPVGGDSGHGDDLARGVLPLGAAGRELGQRALVLVATQRGEFAEFGGDHRDALSGLHEGDAAVTHGVAEPPVHPVRAALHLDPRQRPQQPAGGDLLHLRGRLGGRGEVPRGGGPETLLRGLLLRADLAVNRTNGHGTPSRMTELREKPFSTERVGAITHSGGTVRRSSGHVT
ncbi:hypothetical protein STANM309S_02409 [Streptomyces tanashiensis]